MSKTVQECIDWLWENNSVGGRDYDGIYGVQCVDLPKGLMQFCDVVSWNKSRGDGKDVVTNLYTDGLVTSNPITQSRIKIVSVTGGGSPWEYGHVFVVVDNTVFEQNMTQASSLENVIARGYATWVEGYPTFIKNDDGVVPSHKTVDATVNVDDLNVRDSPSLTGSVVANYSLGQKIYALKLYGVVDGYVWYSYISSTGLTRYVSAGKDTGGYDDNDYLIIE